MDAVITFVDGNRPRWRKQYAKAVGGVTVTISVGTRLLDGLSDEDIELTATTFPTALENTYNLCIRRANVSNITLCHEAVHIKQYADKRLSMTAEGHIIWENEVFTRDNYYFERPWEVEAFGVPI